MKTGVRRGIRLIDPMRYFAAILITIGSPVVADTLKWSGKIELSVRAYDNTGRSATDRSEIYLNVDIGGRYRFSPQTEAFFLAKARSFGQPRGDWAFDSMGIYVDELGIQHEIGDATLTIGKFGLVYGLFGGGATGRMTKSIVSEYEINEAIAARIEMPLGQGKLASQAFFKIPLSYRIRYFPAEGATARTTAVPETRARLIICCSN